MSMACLSMAKSPASPNVKCGTGVTLYTRAPGAQVCTGTCTGGAAGMHTRTQAQARTHAHALV